MLDLGYSYTYSNLQKYINLCMRELKDRLGIKQTLCFYSARKTFAQFASELGIPDGVIDYCLGHSDKSKGIIRFYTKVKQNSKVVPGYLTFWFLRQREQATVIPVDIKGDVVYR